MVTPGNGAFRVVDLAAIKGSGGQALPDSRGHGGLLRTEVALLGGSLLDCVSEEHRCAAGACDARGRRRGLAVGASSHAVGPDGTRGCHHDLEYTHTIVLS